MVTERTPPDPDARLDAESVLKLVLAEFGLEAALFLRLRFLEGWTLARCGEALGGVSEAGMSFRQKNLLATLRRRFSLDQMAKLAGKAA